MWRLILLLILLVTAVLGARQLRDYLIWENWEPLHPSVFEQDDCALYHVMRGMEQDPAADPAHAELMRKCGPDFIPWSLSQTGDPLRFDRPARVRLRFDPIDMHRFSNYPPMVVDFVYPRILLPKEFHVREWGSMLSSSELRHTEPLRAHWNAPWADLFALWSLGRGNHEVWLGGASIENPAVCESVEHDKQRNEDFCRMTLIEAATGQPISIKLPLHRRMEIRLEVLDICRFGGVVRHWQHPWLRKLLGAEEYSDTGCGAF